MNKIKIKNAFETFLKSKSFIPSQITLRVGSDNTVHKASISKSILQWVYDRVVTWQPRIASDLSFALVGSNMTIWSIMSVIGTIGMFTIIKMVSGSTRWIHMTVSQSPV